MQQIFTTKMAQFHNDNNDDYNEGDDDDNRNELHEK